MRVVTDLHDIEIAKMRQKQLGMTMLEVVVTMLIVGLGMAISINMLQASVKYNEEAEFRSIALGQIQQIADHMRVNRLSALDGAYIYPATPVTIVNADQWSLPPAPTTNCSSGCSELQFSQRAAQVDLYEWGVDLRQSLPDGAANVEFVRAAGGGLLSAQYRVTVFWRYIRESAKDNRPTDDFSSFSMLITL